MLQSCLLKIVQIVGSKENYQKKNCWKEILLFDSEANLIFLLLFWCYLCDFNFLCYINSWSGLHLDTLFFWFSRVEVKTFRLLPLWKILTTIIVIDHSWIPERVSSSKRRLAAGVHLQLWSLSGSTWDGVPALRTAPRLSGPVGVEEVEKEGVARRGMRVDNPSDNWGIDRAGAGSDTDKCVTGGLGSIGEAACQRAHRPAPIHTHLQFRTSLASFISQVRRCVSLFVLFFSPPSTQFNSIPGDFLILWEKPESVCVNSRVSRHQGRV